MSPLPPELDRQLDHLFTMVDRTFKQMRPVFDELSAAESKALTKFFIAFVNRVHRRRVRQKQKTGFFDALSNGITFGRVSRGSLASTREVAKQFVAAQIDPASRS
jgi:hypothetical protein